MTTSAKTARHRRREHDERGKAACEPGDGKVAVRDGGFVSERRGRGVRDLMDNQHADGAQEGCVKSLHPHKCRSVRGRSDVTRERRTALSSVMAVRREVLQVGSWSLAAPWTEVAPSKEAGPWTGRHGFVAAPFPRSA